MRNFKKPKNFLPTMKKNIPKSLKVWFLIHFVIDIVFAIPLIFLPVYSLGLFGIQAEVITARLVGAALLGIGGASFFATKQGKESYDILLTLKILWSSAAIVTLLWGIFEGATKILWGVLLIFVVFSGVWWYYKKRLNQKVY